MSTYTTPVTESIVIPVTVGEMVNLFVPVPLLAVNAVDARPTPRDVVTPDPLVIVTAAFTRMETAL